MPQWFINAAAYRWVDILRFWLALQEKLSFVYCSMVQHEKIAFSCTLTSSLQVVKNASWVAASVAGMNEYDVCENC